MKFRREDGEFDVEAFEHAVDVVFLAQEIVVGYSSYPTPEIGRNAKAFRQLGLGYANLGALLMARGLPVRLRRGSRLRGGDHGADDRPRATASRPRSRARMGPFAGYQPNAAAMIGVIAKHRAAVGNIEHTDVGAGRPARRRRARAWDDALDLGEVARLPQRAGDRARADRDDQLHDGLRHDRGRARLLARQVEEARRRRRDHDRQQDGADGARRSSATRRREVEEIVAFIDERNTIVGAPYVKTEHYPVFDCAIGDRAIHYMGHVKMMGAVQPFISGAISKTVNLPEETSVDEVAQLFVESWQLGVKAIAIYRDNCKVAQPLSGEGRTPARRRSLRSRAPCGRRCPQRRRLPDDRIEVGRKFQVGEYEGYIHVGLFEDGTPGDIFVDIAKEGTTLAGLMNSFMISVSLGLQYGVPLEVYVSKFSHMRFEPSGMTNDADIRIAKSIVDYIFRWMGKKFLTADQQEEVGILTAEVKARLAAALRRDGGDAAPAAAPVESPPPGPDGALQPVGGRGRVRQLRRPHGADGHAATRAATAARTPAARSLQPELSKRPVIAGRLSFRASGRAIAARRNALLQDASARVGRELDSRCDEAVTRDRGSGTERGPSSRDGTREALPRAGRDAVHPGTERSFHAHGLRTR